LFGITIVLCAATILAVPGSAAVAADSPVDGFVRRLGPEGVAQMAELLADCGGIYAAFGEVAAAQAPVLAQDYREMQNGAMVAAAYLLYRDHVLRTAETRPFADFVQPVRARAEARAAQVGARFAANDLEGPKVQLGECARLEEPQSFLVRGWRAEMRPE
jgi:hypothetical protein